MIRKTEDINYSTKSIMLEEKNTKAEEELEKGESVLRTGGKQWPRKKTPNNMKQKRNSSSSTGGKEKELHQLGRGKRACSLQ